MVGIVIASNAYLVLGTNPTNLALFRHKITLYRSINRTNQLSLFFACMVLRFVMYIVKLVGYELVLGTSWLGYELAWYDLVRVRVDWKPSLVMSLSVDRQYRFTDNEIRAALNNVGNVVGVFPGTLVFPQVFQLLCTKPWMSVSCNYFIEYNLNSFMNLLKFFFFYKPFCW